MINPFFIVVIISQIDSKYILFQCYAMVYHQARYRI